MKKECCQSKADNNLKILRIKWYGKIEQKQRKVEAEYKGVNNPI